MSDRFRSVNRQMPYLMPPSLEEWLPEDHLARFVVETVEHLDTTALEEAYDGRGSEAYHPKMLLALLFYGYATGTFSSRKIEEATYDSVAFRYVAANQHPDHDTICTFRRRFLKELEGLFVQILEVAVEMGLLEVGDVALDGTKVKANASKHKALSYEYACKLEEQLTEEVEELMEKAEEADAEGLPEETSVPEEIARREERLKKIREAKQTIEERAQKRYEAEKAAYEEKWKSAGKRKSRPAAKNQVPSRSLRKTPDPSRTIRSTSPTRSRGSCPRAKTGSNRPTTRRQLSAWIVTSSLRGISVNRPTTNKSWSRRFRGWTSCPRRSAVRIDWLPAAGTTPRATPRRARTTGSLPTSAPAARSLGQTWRKRFSDPGEPPDEESGLEAMAYRLETREGKDFYGRRKGTAEPIFGIIKEVLGIRQFLLRGLKKVEGEWALIRCAFNLKRMHRLPGEAA